MYVKRPIFIEDHDALGGLSDQYGSDGIAVYLNVVGQHARSRVDRENNVLNGVVDIGFRSGGFVDTSNIERYPGFVAGCTKLV